MLTINWKSGRAVFRYIPARQGERIRALRSSGDVAERQLVIMFYTYILQSVERSRLYVGSTEDLKNRFKEHNAGKVRSTKSYCPWKLIYYEAHLTKLLARQAEIFYKTSQGRRQLNKKLGLE